MNTLSPSDAGVVINLPKYKLIVEANQNAESKTTYVIEMSKTRNGFL